MVVAGSVTVLVAGTAAVSPPSLLNVTV
jgi:hypothetical protein